jgi:hypothetical protein
MQAIGCAENAALRFISDLVQKIRLAAIWLGQGEFAIAQRALPVFLDTHTLYSQNRANAQSSKRFQSAGIKQPRECLSSCRSSAMLWDG